MTAEEMLTEIVFDDISLSSKAWALKAMKAYAEQERKKAFNAARKREFASDASTLKLSYDTYDFYLLKHPLT